MPEVLGLDCKLYYKIGGIGGGGSWLELSNVKDVNFVIEIDEAEATTRANNGWKAVVAALKTGSIEFDMVWNRADAGFTAIKNAALGADAAARLIGIQALDGENGEGLQADMNVFKFGRNEPLTEVATVPVSLKVAYSANPPTWLEAA